MVSFENTVAAIIETLGNAGLGIDPDKIRFGGLVMEPPSINIAAYPIERSQSENASGFRGHLMRVEIYINPPTATDELLAMIAAVELGGKVAHALTSSRVVQRFLGIALVEKIDEKGQILETDRPSVVASFEAAFEL